MAKFRLTKINPATLKRTRLTTRNELIESFAEKFGLETEDVVKLSKIRKNQSFEVTKQKLQSTTKWQVNRLFQEKVQDLSTATQQRLVAIARVDDPNLSLEQQLKKLKRPEQLPPDALRVAQFESEEAEEIWVDIRSGVKVNDAKTWEGINSGKVRRVARERVRELSK